MEKILYQDRETFKSFIFFIFMIMRDSDLKILCSIGLSKTEAKIYIDLVKNPESTIIDIAVRNKFHRPNVYDVVRRLKDRGLIKEIHKKGKTISFSANTNSLNSYIGQIGDEVKKFVADLEKISKTKEEKESVSIFEGMISMKEEMMRVLKLEDVSISLLGDHSELIDRKLSESFHKKRIGKEIKLRIIFSSMHKENMKRLNNLSNTEIRYFDFLKDVKLSTAIVGDTVYHISYRNGKPIIIKIKHKEIAKEQQAFFDSFWKKAKKL